MKKRIVALLTAVALMVVMLAMSVAPAFAAKEAYNCRLSDKFTTEVRFVSPGISLDRNGDGIFCIYRTPQKARGVDNHPALRE